MAAAPGVSRNTRGFCTDRGTGTGVGTGTGAGAGTGAGTGPVWGEHQDEPSASGQSSSGPALQTCKRPLWLLSVCDRSDGSDEPGRAVSNLFDPCCLPSSPPPHRVSCRKHLRGAEAPQSSEKCVCDAVWVFPVHTSGKVQLELPHHTRLITAA